MALKEEYRDLGHAQYLYVISEENADENGNIDSTQTQGK